MAESLRDSFSGPGGVRRYAQEFKFVTRRSGNRFGWGDHFRRMYLFGFSLGGTLLVN
jgi:hypothetical protein